MAGVQLPYQNGQLVQGIATEFLDHQGVPITSTPTLLNIRAERTSITIQNPSDNGKAVFLGKSTVVATAENALRGIELHPGQARSLDVTSDVDVYAVAKASDVLVLGSLDVNTIAWRSGTTVRYTFNGSPNLSTVSAGMWLKVASAANSSNNGCFVITAVNDGSDYIEVTNAARTDADDDEASDSAAVGTAEDPIWITIEETR